MNVVIKKTITLILVCFLISTLSSMPSAKADPFSGASEPRFIFITNNSADYELASAVDQTMNLSATFVDIKTSEDLNQLFLTGNYFKDYDSIILILNQITNPFNENLVSSLAEYITEGNLFGIISTQIWKFNTYFHSLMGLNVTMQGQKEYPMGNITHSIQISITNDSLLHNPFQYTENTTIALEGGVGIAQSTASSYQVAFSSNPPYGNTSLNAFQYESGFLFALPLSPIEVSPSLTSLSQFVTSLTYSGIELLERNQLEEESTISPDKPLFLIIEENLETAVVIGGISTLLLGLVFFISQFLTKPKVTIDLPKDKTFLSFLLSPFFLIGQILYPPIVRRIDSYDVLENEYRSQILNILDEKEFLHFRELKRELKIGTSSLRWHLQVLEDFRIIDRRVYGQYEIYHLLRRIPEPGFLELYFSIISGGGYRVAQAFSRVSSWKLNTLAEYLGQSKEAVRYHLKKLEQIKLIHFDEIKYILNPQKVLMLKSALERRSKSN